MHKGHRSLYPRKYRCIPSRHAAETDAQPTYRVRSSPTAHSRRREQFQLAVLRLGSPHWNHRASIRKRLYPISPVLHHCSALTEVFCPVISCAYSIAFLMGELTLDHIRSETHFIQRGRGHRTEAVNGRSTVITHTVQGIEHRVVAHASFPRGRREQKWTCV